MATSFYQWCLAVIEVEKAQKIVEKTRWMTRRVSERIATRRLHEGFEKWAVKTTQLQNLRDRCRAVVVRLTLRTMGRALTGWQDGAAKSIRLHHTAARIVFRLQSASMGRTFWLALPDP